MEKTPNPQHLDQKVKNPSKSKKKPPKMAKEPSFIEYIKARIQASIEKGGSLPKVEAKFINEVKNCFWMTEQEAIQDPWQWRKSL